MVRISIAFWLAALYMLAGSVAGQPSPVATFESLFAAIREADAEGVLRQFVSASTILGTVLPHG